MNIVYGLFEPTGELRYVGRSTKGLQGAKRHLTPWCIENDFSPKGCWVRSLDRKGQRPELAILEKCESREATVEAERFWIANAKFLGCQLVNVTAGGDGGLVRARRSLNSSSQGDFYTALKSGKFADATDEVIANELKVSVRQAKRYVSALRKAKLIQTTVTRYPLPTGWVNKRKIEVTQ